MRSLLKKVYNSLPFKKQVFSCIRFFWSPPVGIYKHLHFKGVFRVRTSGSNSFLVRHYGYQVENEIFWKGIEGGWEKVSFSLWIKLCRKANVILDVGANTGIFSLIAQAENPAAHIYAFEPVMRVYKKLEENIALNKYDILPVRKALSNSDGQAIIYDDTFEHTYSVTVNKNLRDPGADVSEVEIDIMRLSTFIKDNHIARIDLMKIDVETHEPEVLEGMGEYLDLFRPAMLIEVLNDEIGQRIEELVNGKDYLFFNIHESRGLQQVKSITASDSFNYLLCDRATARSLDLIAD